LRRGPEATGRSSELIICGADALVRAFCGFQNPSRLLDFLFTFPRRNRQMKLAPLLLLVCSAVAVAQTTKKQVSMSESASASSERKGAWDGAFWGGGGHTVSGGVQGVGIANAGVRIGKILTEQHGSGW